MKRCPKCNRTFTTNTQKFCTHDGGILEGVDMGPETIRINTAEFSDGAPTKVISRELVPEAKPAFDPFKTVISRSEGTVAQTLRDTSDISPPPATTMAPRPQSPSPSAPDQISPVAPPSSVPLPPPQASPSAPTMALTGSIPLAASAQPAPAQTSQPTPAPLSPVAPAKKKSRLPLVLGILLVLFIFGGGVVGALYWFVARPMLAARKVVVVDTPPPPTRAPTPNIVATPRIPETRAPEPPAYSPAADAVEFVNSKQHLAGALAEHYVDFSFYYPDRWQKDPTAGVAGARNFAQVERRLPPDFTQENFAVAWNSSAAPVAENRALFHTLAENLGAQFAKKFPGYKKVSEGETKVGVYAGYEFRFEGVSTNTAKGDLKLWGRVVFLPPQDGGKDGVTLLMLATSLAPELRSANDVGVKGGLPMMLESFRFGKK